MTNILEISDGTTTINLLSANFGFCLNNWQPQIAQPKRGGIFQSSPLSEGRKLVDRKFENIQDTFEFDIKGSGQPETITYITNLINLLEQAAEYWTGNADKVWLKAKADCEDEPRYALIVNYSWPELKFPYGNTFFAATEIASMINVDLGIEHGLWQATIPGEGECAEGSSVQTWQYEPLWMVNTTVPATTVAGLMQAANGYLYAGDVGNIYRSIDNGASWVLNTALPVSIVSDIFQLANGNIVANDGGGNIFLTTDNGAIWASVSVLPTGNGYFVQLSDGTVLCSDLNRILESTDNGATWAVKVSVSTLITTIRTMIITSDGDILAAGDNSRIIKSTDDGVTWVVSSITPNDIISLIELENGNFLYGGTAIYLSTDGAESWSLVENTASSVSSLLQLANGDILAGNNANVWISKDNGLSWDQEFTVASGILFDMIESASLDVYGSGTDEIHRRTITTVEMGRGATCDNEVYIINKQDTANFTHVKQDDGGVFTDLLPMTVFPVDLFPAVPVANDALYFGIDEDVDDEGIFDSIVFDLASTFASLSGVSLALEYWNGAWAALTNNTDNTSPTGSTANFLSIAGVNSIHWEPPSDWAKTTVDSITGFWARLRITATGGTITSTPTQQNRDVYTIKLPYVNVASTEILGNTPALLQSKAQNQSDLGGRDVSTPDVDLWTNRLICGLRSVERSSLFQAYLNASDEGNPIQVTVSLGTNTTFSDNTQTTTGRLAQYNPAGVEAMANRVTFSLNASIIDDFYGKYHAFLRVQRTAGAITDFNIQLQIVSGSGGIQFTTVSKQVQSTTAFELLDFGQVELPVGGLFKPTDLGDVAEIRVQVSAASGVPNLNIYDLILIPVDEWSVDSVDFANTDDSIVGRDDTEPKLLDVDSITNPKIDVQSLVRSSANNFITSIYDTISPGKAILQENTHQRLWFLAAQTSATGASFNWIAQPEIAHSIQLFKAERYLTFSKGEE